MQKAYQRINWENEPSTATPLNDDNLNKIDYSLNVIDNRVVEIFAYKETMEEKVEEAAGSATLAAGSASDAEDSATASASSATQSSGYATNSANSATASANSATQSANSATQSAGYASDSADSATASADSASEALQSEQDAEAWAVGQRNGSDVTETDVTYQNNSKYYSEQSASSASDSASSAVESANSATRSSTSATQSANSASQSYNYATQSSTYATNSANSATQSNEYAENSLDYATLSESWAIGGTGVRQGENTNNAEYWARQAAAVITGVGSFNGRSGIVLPEAGDYTAEMIAYDDDYSVGTKLEEIANLIRVATTTRMGLVRPDGDTIFIDSNGIITSGISDTDWETIQNILS